MGLPTFRLPVSAVSRIDGWINTLTALGTSRDKSTATTFVKQRPLHPDELDALMSGDDLAERIVTAVVDDALRQGFCPTRKTKDDADAERMAEVREEIEKELKRLEARERIHDAAVWGRGMGGGLVLSVEGGGDPARALDDTKVKHVAALYDFDRRELTPRTVKGREPDTWFYNPISPWGGSFDQTNLVVHNSRVILFPGAKTTKRARQQNQGWDESVLQRCWNIVRDVNTQWSSVTAMFSDMSQAVFKLRGLFDAIASAEAGEAVMAKRVQLMDMLRSVARAIVLDAGSDGEAAESFEVVERGAMTGVDSLLDKGFLRLACAARMPVTKLMGQSPAGMNATGEGDRKVWYDEVKTYQTNVLKPRVDRVIRMVAREFDPEHAEEWEAEFPPLEQMSETEQATLEKTRVDTAAVAVEKLGVLPEEAVLALDEMAPGLGIEIDKDVRRAALDDALELLKNPPEPGAIDPATGQPVAPPGQPVPPGQQPPKPGEPAPPAPPKPGEEEPPKVPKTDEFNEEDHPRDEDGKFGSGGGSSSKERKEKAKEVKKSGRDKIAALKREKRAKTKETKQKAREEAQKQHDAEREEIAKRETSDDYDDDDKAADLEEHDAALSDRLYDAEIEAVEELEERYQDEIDDTEDDVEHEVNLLEDDDLDDDDRERMLAERVTEREEYKAERARSRAYERDLQRRLADASSDEERASVREEARRDYEERARAGKI